MAAYVAAGRFDAYYAFDNHVWDVAGATVLIREAGGLVSNVDEFRSTTLTRRMPWPPTGRSIRS